MFATTEETNYCHLEGEFWLGVTFHMLNNPSTLIIFYILECIRSPRVAECDCRQTCLDSLTAEEYWMCSMCRFGIGIGRP